MKIKDLLLTFLLILLWGLNFVVIRVGLNGFPPLLLAAARFAFAAFPLVLFLPRPKASLKHIIGYGLSTFALQFSFLFTGIHLGLSPGLASLILQLQAFFSIGLAALVFKERPSLWKLGGALIALFGLAIVAVNISGGTSGIGLALTLAAALSWATGNMFSKKVIADSPLSLVVWGSLVALPALAALSLFIEGPDQIVGALKGITWSTALAIVYLVYLSTHLCYGLWGYLLNRYPTSVVAPFTLLIPIIGFASSTVFLGEDFPIWKLAAALLVLAGLGFNLLELPIKRLFAKNRI